jgi:hypothetical protein
MVGRVINAVAIEHRKVVIHVFYLFQERLEDVWSLMQVIENNSSK